MLLVILASAKPSLSANALATQSVDVNFVEGTLYSAPEQVSARKPDVALVECSDDAGDLDQLNKLQESTTLFSGASQNKPQPRFSFAINAQWFS